MAPSPSRQRNRLVATTIFLLHIVAFSSANCFLPNGTDRNTILWDSHGIDYQPSGYGSPADDFQMCCATNNRETPDLPRKDGLCNDLAGIWRESCTDPTWKSPSCVKLCIDGIGMSSISSHSCMPFRTLIQLFRRRTRQEQKRSRLPDYTMSRSLLLLRRQEHHLLYSRRWCLAHRRPTHEHQPHFNPIHNILYNTDQHSCPCRRPACIRSTSNTRTP